MSFDPNPKQKAEDFYFRCYADRENWQKYADLAAALIVMEDDGSLGEDEKDAVQYGDCFTVNDICSGPNGSALLNFFKAVHADSRYTAKLGQVHTNFLDEYGADLSYDQRNAILSGDARLLSQMLMDENGGLKPGYAIVVWTIGYSKPGP